jgi:coenzyme F420-0:L-glutamate ligase
VSKLIYGGVSKALLTLKNNIWTANAGVDHKNVPKGYVALWPKNSQKSGEKIRKMILERTGRQVGVLIIDSHVTPLRMGTTGVALGIAGFEPVRDYRFDKDLYGNSIHITRHAIADDIASAAHLMMGESSEQTPVILVRNAPVKLCDRVDLNSTIISPKECLFSKLLLQKPITESR